MRKKYRKMSYFYFFKKVFIVFGAMYFIIMSLFTYSKQQDIRSKHRIFISYEEQELMNEIKMILELDDEEIKRHCLRMILTGKCGYSKDYPIYFKTKLYIDEEEIAYSSHFMDNNELGKLEEEGYIDLEKWLTKGELVRFIKSIYEDEVKDRKLRITGYRDKESLEVFPERIETFTGEKNKQYASEVSQEAVPISEEQYNQEGESQTIQQVFEFNNKVEQTPNIEPYVSEELWSLIGQPLNYSKLISEKNLNRLSEVENKVDEWKANKTLGGNWSENIIQVDYVDWSPVYCGGKTYHLVLGARYYPLEIAINRLKSVYIFSLLVIFLMSSTLAYSLWKNEQKARELEENRKRLVDAIGHELKTPLALLRAYSEGLKDNIVEEKRTHYLEVIMDEVDRMNELIVKMLTLSKMENEAYVLRKEQFCLNDLVYQVIQNQQALIDKKGLQLQIEEIEKIKISADCKSIECVISNLLSNAVRHATNKGKICIHISSQLLSIENEGQPIKEEQLNLIWNPFFKGEGGDDRTGEGTGLGLTIVRQILNLHYIKHGVCNTDIGVKFWFEIKNVLKK